MDRNKYIKDLEEIKDIMNRSSRFISLSGMSGIIAGVIALMAAYVAYRTVFEHQFNLGIGQEAPTPEKLTALFTIAATTLILSVGAGIYFTTRETKRKKLKIWDHQTKRLLFNLAIPLLSGGLLCLMLVFKGYADLLTSLTLIFYGLALLNASKYTLNEIRSLGIIEIVLGLTAIHFTEFSLLFWAFGFGILHIIYGVVMHIRSES